MTNLERAGAIAGIALPLLAGAWWAGSGYVEFADRLTALEQQAEELHEFRDRYEREQVRDSLVNEQVSNLTDEVDWLRWHHHSVPQGGDTGRAHIDD